MANDRARALRTTMSDAERAAPAQSAFRRL